MVLSGSEIFNEIISTDMITSRSLMTSTPSLAFFGLKKIKKLLALYILSDFPGITHNLLRKFGPKIRGLQLIPGYSGVQISWQRIFWARN